MSRWNVLWWSWRRVLRYSASFGGQYTSMFVKRSSCENSEVASNLRDDGNAFGVLESPGKWFPPIQEGIEVLVGWRISCCSTKLHNKTSPTFLSLFLCLHLPLPTRSCCCSVLFPFSLQPKWWRSRYQYLSRNSRRRIERWLPRTACKSRACSTLVFLHMLVRTYE